MKTDNISHTLPAGFILNKQYIIDSVRGEGGFGITYAGHIIDSLPDTRIAIKEYFPSGVAGRSHQTTPYEVTHFGGKYGVSFRKGLHRFFNEAVLLKRFAELESIVTILDVFEENNTAYIIMEYIEGISLRQLIDSEGILSFDEMFGLMLPVMNDLSVIHEQGLIHRDISPDNLLVGTDNRLHLIDFGAADYCNPNESKTITVMLKAGYAPPEQYLTNGRIGPWTDVYGLCATMYYVLEGKTPPDAVARMQSRDNSTLTFSNDTDISEFRLNALVRGLSLSYSERFSSVKALCQALTTPVMQAEEITVMMPFYGYGILHKLPHIIKRHISSIITGLIAGGIILFLVLSPTANTSNAVPDSSISKADTVHATVAATLLKMTDLTGSTLETAIKKITKLDSSISINTSFEYSNTYDAGIVTDQNTAAGYTFYKGELDSITLTVSKGALPEQSVNANEQIQAEASPVSSMSANDKLPSGDKTAEHKTSAVKKPDSSASDNKTSANKSSESKISENNKSGKAASQKQNSPKKKTTNDKYTTIHLN